MCGIAGIIKFTSEVHKEEILRMSSILSHRGPDGEGVWINTDRKVGFGHRRLSIIDLSESASQPMFYAEKRFVIIFNGEIYNYLELKNQLLQAGYEFLTSSDTEVLLAMFHWKGKDMLNHLDGMFSFAIWDNLTNKLFCARDRYGEKPFYYSLSKDGFYFASEMKALFASGISTEIEKSMIANYLFNDLLINPNSESKTFYSNIKKLEKSSYLEIDLDQNFSIHKYYKIDTTIKPIGLEESTEIFYSLLNDSVNKRMRSDVRIGSSLSGGLDSSVLVYLIQQNLIKANSKNANTTFSARFNEEGISENQYLDCILNDLKLENHSIYPNENLIHEELDRVFYYQEEPFLSTSILNQWSVMRLANQNNVTVLLDGQGADEMLGGYGWHNKIYLMELYKNSKLSFKDEIEGRVKNGFSKEKVELIDWMKINFNSGMKIASKLKHYSFKKWGFHALSQNAIWYGILNDDFCDLGKVNLPMVKSYDFNLNEVLYKDHSSLVLETLLRYSDRNSMAFSREVRLPYLSHMLVDFCFSLDPKLKIQNGWQKHILRRAFENKIPDKIIWRKDKIGYSAPEEKWLNSEVNEEFILDNWHDLQNSGVIKKNIPLLSQTVWKMLMLNSLLKFSNKDFSKC